MKELSFSQKRIFALDQIAPENSHTGNIPFAMQITGALDIAALEKSINKIVARHEIFRTSCKNIDNRPVLSIAPELSIVFEIEDLSSLPESDQQANISKSIEKHALERFDLGTAPILRCKLIITGENQYIFLITTHIFVFDGWSSQIFFKELSSFYQEFFKNKETNLPALTMQYSDFARWHSDFLKGKVLEDQISYWQEILSGAKAITSLNPAFGKQGTSANISSIIYFNFPDFITSELKKLTQDKKATLFMTLAAAFQTLLYLYTKNEDIITGTIVSNRRLAETENMIGPFANNILIRSDFSSNPNFAQIIKQIGKTSAGSYSNQDIPFEILQEKLGPELKRIPLFRIMFLLHQHAGKSGLTLPGLNVKMLKISKGSSKYELNLVMTDVDQKLSGAMEYKTELFDKSSAEKIIADFMKIVKKVSENPDIEVSSLHAFIKPLAVKDSSKIYTAIINEEYKPPKTETESAIVEIWQNLLAIDKIGINDNFFYLGGHSLLATRVLSRLQKRFKIYLPIRQLFKSPTPAAMANLIESAKDAAKQIEYNDIKPAIRDQNFLLSYAQQRLWFLDQMESGSPFYNITTAYRLTGSINIDALEQSLNYIIDRHESLRTIFQSIDGAAQQVIMQNINFELKKIDLRAYLDNAADKADKIIEQEAKTVFDLSSGPLFRASLIRLKDSENILVLNMHHIISDGWSMGVLFKELAACYDSYCKAVSPDLPLLNIQYADFALWQRNYLSGKILEDQLAYWKKKLDKSDHLLELPTDYLRPAVLTYNGDTKFFVIDRSLIEKLTLFCNNQGVTLFMTFLAAFNVLLYRYTGKENINIGSPIAGRNREEIEGLIGFFVNTMVLRTDISGNPNFIELLAQIKETALDAYTHQDIPFEKLVEELSPERNLSHTPLFQVMFVFQDDPYSGKNFSDLDVKKLELAEKTAKFDLTLSMVQDKEKIRGSINFNTALFKHDTIERMIGHLKTLLNGIADNPDRKVSQLPILTEEERQKILIEFNDKAADYPKDKCIHQLFEEQAAKTPDAVAVVFEEKSITYKELNSRANKLACYLKKLGAGPDVLIGICMERSLDIIVGIMGILKSGGAYLPLDPDYPPQRLFNIIEDSKIATVITQKHFENLFYGKLLNIIDMEKKEIDNMPDTDLTDKFPSNRLIYTIFTSGSTGRPKGSAVYQNSFVNLVYWFVKEFDFKERDCDLIISSMSFDLTQKNIFAPLITGGKLHLMPSGYDPEKIIETVDREQITWLNCAPSMFYPIISECNELIIKKLSSLKYVFLGGEPISMNMLTKWLNIPECNTKLINSYGPTECTDVCACYPLHNPKYFTGNTLPIGKPIYNTKIYIVDNRLNPVPIGGAGELCITGTCVGAGYYREPELTAEKFIENPFLSEIKTSDDDFNIYKRMYKTGDLVKWLPDGNIEYIGRIDNQVKIRGLRIELSEIEYMLLKNPAVKECIVNVYETKSGDKQLAAYAVKQTEEGKQEVGDTELSNILYQYLKNTLPDYMIPAYFIFTDKLPLTPNGKIDRKALPKPNLKNMKQGYTQPRNLLEYELSKIWEDILNISPVGIFDNFFKIGGHSLLAVQLVSKIKKQFKKDVPIADLFQNNTIAKLSPVIGNKTISRKWSPIVNIKSKGAKNPIFCVHAAGGTVFSYIRLSALLEYDGPFYGLQAKGIEKGDEPLKSIEEMAEVYLKAIKKVQPKGPYFLSGWSMGAVIAFEMACLLQKQGEQISCLIMIDPPPPTMKKDQVLEDDIEFIVERFEHVTSLNLNKVQQLGEKEEQLSYIFNKIKTEEIVPSDIDVSDFKRFFKLHKLNNYITCEYRPKSKYLGKIFFIRVKDLLPYDLRMDEPVVVWEKFASQGLKTYEVPANHFNMLNETNAKYVAEKINIIIKEVLT